MKKYKQTTKIELILSILSCTMFVVVYWLSFYELYTLCKSGRDNKNIKVLFVSMIFFLVWFIIWIIRIIRKRKLSLEKIEDIYEFYWRLKNKFICLVAIALAVITCFYGAKIYHSAINYNGKLAWFLQDLKNKRTVSFEHNNIYQYGVDGIFKDINKKVCMPKKLYVQSSFSLKFDANGRITAFDTYLYGKNDNDKLESYLISYDMKKSSDIVIYLNGHVDANYSKDKLLEPLIKTMKVIPLKKTVSKWNEKNYGILYYGKRSFGYNAEGIVNISSKGKLTPKGNDFSEAIGYIVSVFVPRKENIYTPVRYNLVDGIGNIKASDSNNKEKIEQPRNSWGEFYLSKKVGYRLEVTAAALGNRSYSLNKTTDGANWKTVNDDPFNGAVGTASGITFLNDKLGFLCLAYNGGGNGDLYRTADGGVSYTKVSFPDIKTNSRFDLPAMPYKKDGRLEVLVGQGSDGDRSKVLYQSSDNGVTWQYIKEVSKN
ncbi:membrane protein [Clostridium acetobutylicum]|nr:membrane protein [Clostridium acetobutylicum]